MQGRWVFLDVSGKPKSVARLACREEGERGKNWEECKERKRVAIIIATIH